MEKKYTVVITEILQRKAPVTVESKEIAEQIVERQYYNQEHILDESDLTARSFKAKTA